MSILFDPLFTAENASGASISGAKLHFYATGTTTHATIYADSGKTTPLANPQTADSAGRFVSIYLDEATTYRFKLFDSDGTTLIRDVDPFNPDLVAASSLTSGDVTGALGYTPVPNTRAVSAGTGLTGGGNLTGDVTLSLANMAANTIRGNNTASSGPPLELTRTQARALVLPDFTGKKNRSLAVNSAENDATWTGLPMTVAGLFTISGTTVTAAFSIGVSVSRVSTGVYTITLTSAASSATNWAVYVTGGLAGTGNIRPATTNTSTRAAGSINVTFKDAGNGLSDPDEINVLGFVNG